MLNLAPLPSWRSLFLSLFGSRNMAYNWKRLWQRDADEMVGFLSRSAWSLALVVLWRQRMMPGRKICIWIPDYYCNSSLMPLRRLDVRLYFYPITNELEPDYGACREQARLAVPDIFIHVHYFGCPKPASRAREFCNRHGSWLVEDAAHVLSPTGCVGKEGDFVFYSPHKLLAMPAGAVLVARPNGASRLGLQNLADFGLPETWPKQLAIWRSDIPTAQQAWGGLVWLVKRLLQKLGARRRASLPPFHDVHPPVKAALPAPLASSFALRMLVSEAFTLSDVARRRQRNLMLIDELLSGCDDWHLTPVARPADREWVPYAAVYESAHNAAGVHRALRQNGLPATTWPDLPPEVIAQPQQHSVAIRLREQRIYLPVHQSLSAFSLFSLLFSGASQLDGNGIIVDWDKCSQKEWDEWMQKVDSPNLLQSWSYGEAKANVEGWKVRRGVISGPLGPMACVQALQKNVGGLFTVTRINRGPLFLPSIPPAFRLAALSALCRALSGWRKGQVLSWAPELVLDGRSLAVLAQSGVRQFASRSWETSLIDLRLDETQLRAQATGRWRNMLAAAQRQEMVVECLEDEADFEALLMGCQNMLKGRQVDFSADLYRELRRQLILAKAPGILLAIRAGGEMAAAIWVVPHGGGATYLLGWSGIEGRRWNAHYLLLWEAMLRLKQLGVRWFDTGGIDQENASGIASFKLGLGGRRHALVGEGWCY